MFLAPVTQEDIKLKMKSLNDTATGYGEINAMSLKLVNQFITQPLTHLCNLSLTKRVFPEQLKIANGIPLYKTEDSTLFNNYRPVSLLCVLSKVFEKVMYDRIISFLENFKILNENQFRKKQTNLQIYLNGSTKSYGELNPSFRERKICCWCISWFFKGFWYCWSWNIIR